MSDTMTDAPAARTRSRSAASRAQVAEVADTFVSLMRAFQRARNRLMAAAEHDVEWSAHVLLRALSSFGPMRAGSLAECVQSDPSTVSRQVASMVKDGLLERRADPEDGRASLLVPTAKADAVLLRSEEIRLDFFARVFRGWTPAELETFGELLTRFTAAYDAASTDLLPDRFAARTAGQATATRAAASH